MALSDTINLSPNAPTAASGSEKVYVLTGRDGTSSTRMNQATDLSNPELLVIKHQKVGSETNGGTIVDRHLIQLSRTERDANGKAHAMIVNFTLAIPRNGLFSDGETDGMCWQLANLLLDANIAKIVRGET